MFNISEVLYGTLDTFAKVYGLKIVIKVCQQFIIDSIKEEEERDTTNVVVSASSPAPAPASAPKK